MSGRTELLLYPILFLSAVSAFTDLWRGKIYNWLTLPMLLLGVVFSGVIGGWPQAGDAGLGVLLGLLLYGVLFFLRVVGGGDVKLLMALGAWGGARYVTSVAVLGVILGGALALALLVFSGRIVSFVRRLYHFLLVLFVRELAVEPMKVDHKLTMPFGVPIAMAAVWVAWNNPLERWGMLLW